MIVLTQGRERWFLFETSQITFEISRPFDIHLTWTFKAMQLHSSVHQFTLFKTESVLEQNNFCNEIISSSPMSYSQLVLLSAGLGIGNFYHRPSFKWSSIHTCQFLLHRTFLSNLSQFPSASRSPNHLHQSHLKFQTDTYIYQIYQLYFSVAMSLTWLWCWDRVRIECWIDFVFKNGITIH